MVITMGDIALKDTLMPLTLELVVADYRVVEEGDVPLAVVEGEGGAGGKVHWCTSPQCVVSVTLAV